MAKLTIAQAKEIDLVEYLASLGLHPQKIRNQDHWYLSPLREEKTASFKVNRERKIWYDHGSGKGGDLIDFGTLYFKCSVKELLDRLVTYGTFLNSSFHPPLTPSVFAGEKKEDRAARIIITEVRPLAAENLLAYLEKRNIPIHIASLYCKEVDFVLYGNKHTVIGFQNNDGGYELRSPDFKGSSAPKAITFVDHQCGKLSVFEGFFDYLSHLSILNKSSHPTLSNFLILNSTAFFEKSKTLMEQHSQVNLYLDRDHAGEQCTAMALQWDTQKFRDQSWSYKGHKDLNELMITKKQEKKQAQSYKPGL